MHSDRNTGDEHHYHHNGRIPLKRPEYRPAEPTIILSRPSTQNRTKNRLTNRENTDARSGTCGRKRVDSLAAKLSRQVVNDQVVNDQFIWEPVER